MIIGVKNIQKARKEMRFPRQNMVEREGRRKLKNIGVGGADETALAVNVDAVLGGDGDIRWRR